jgi:hypothetical protein
LLKKYTTPHNLHGAFTGAAKVFPKITAAASSCWRMINEMLDGGKSQGI